MKSNKYFFFAITALLLFVTSCKESEFAKFSFTMENLAVAYNSEIEIGIDVIDSDIASIELEIGDSIVKKWDNPSKKLTYKLKANDFGIGAKNLVLIVRNNDGELFKDERIMRIVSDIQPEIWAFDIVSTFPHNIANFTQGLEFDGNQLYEGTGQLGESKVAKIDLATGNDINKIGLDATHFGEGITIMGDTIYQLTWQTNKCFMYNKNTLQILPQDFTYQGEGWGLCNNGRQLIMSDGSERLTFRNPKTFEIIRTIEVYTHENPVIRLNELEYINGHIYANIWGTNNIAVIEPETGRVIGVINGSELVTLGRGSIGEAFNGIAYNQSEDAIYLTGKNWEKTFKIKLKKSAKELAQD